MGFTSQNTWGVFCWRLYAVASTEISCDSLSVKMFAMHTWAIKMGELSHCEVRICHAQGLMFSCLAYDLLSHFLGFLLQFLYIYILDFWGLSRFFLTLFYPLLDSSTFFTIKMFYVYIYIYTHFSVEHDVYCSKNADIFPSFGLVEWEHLFKSGLCKIQNWQIGSLVFHEFELNWPHSTERWIGI